MAQFGPNGTVIQGTGIDSARSYSSDEKIRIKRVALAVFLCGIAASILVALIALAIAVTYSTLTAFAGRSPNEILASDGFLAGAYMAVMIAGFNWFVFYIVVPITWILLAVSIGTFPRRGIWHHAPYYRWGGIWGGALVALPTAVIGGGTSGSAALGALLTGTAIGVAAGLICASLFLAIVRPKAQLSDIQADVF